MSGLKSKGLTETQQVDLSKNKKKTSNKKWQKPALEDVSGKIMAQPYIRFT